MFPTCSRWCTVASTQYLWGWEELHTHRHSQFPPQGAFERLLSQWAGSCLAEVNSVTAKNDGFSNGCVDDIELAAEGPEGPLNRGFTWIIAALLFRVFWGAVIWMFHCLRFYSWSFYSVTLFILRPVTQATPPPTGLVFLTGSHPAQWREVTPDDERHSGPNTASKRPPFSDRWETPSWSSILHSSAAGLFFRCRVSVWSWCFLIQSNKTATLRLEVRGGQPNPDGRLGLSWWFLTSSASRSSSSNTAACSVVPTASNYWLMGQSWKQSPNIPDTSTAMSCCWGGKSFRDPAALTSFISAEWTKLDVYVNVLKMLDTAVKQKEFKGSWICTKMECLQTNGPANRLEPSPTFNMMFGGTTTPAPTAWLCLIHCSSYMLWSTSTSSHSPETPSNKCFFKKNPDSRHGLFTSCTWADNWLGQQITDMNEQ